MGAAVWRRHNRAAGGSLFLCTFFFLHWKRHRSHQKTSKTSKNVHRFAVNGQRAPRSGRVKNWRAASHLRHHHRSGTWWHFQFSPPLSSVFHHSPVFSCSIVATESHRGDFGTAKSPRWDLKLNSAGCWRVWRVWPIHFKLCVYLCTNTEPIRSESYFHLFFSLKINGMKQQKRPLVSWKAAVNEWPQQMYL